MNILVTGGTGYIGSHTCVELLSTGHQMVVLDNFSNSHSEALRRVEKITDESLAVVRGDIRMQGALEVTYAEPTLVEQFLGWKSERDLAAMCKDHWRWQKQNPQGYV